MGHEPTNMMEDNVLSTINKAAGELNCCTCDKCKMELAAYVLNRLPAKYVDTEKGALFTRANHFNQDFSTKVLLEVTRAATEIGKAPGHE